MRFPSAALLLILLAGCQSAPVQSRRADSGSGADAGSDTGYRSVARGTFSGAVTGSFNDGMADDRHAYHGGLTAGELAILSTDITITGPSGTTAQSFEAIIMIDGPPVVGTYQSSDRSVCGSMLLLGQTDSSPYTVQYRAATRDDCYDYTVTPYGSFTVQLTSTERYEGTTDSTSDWVYYVVHGTLDATLEDTITPTNPPTTLHVAF